MPIRNVQSVSVEGDKAVILTGNGYLYRISLPFEGSGFGEISCDRLSLVDDMSKTQIVQVIIHSLQ